MIDKVIRHSSFFIWMTEDKTVGILKLQRLLRIHDPQCLALVFGLERRLDDGFFLAHVHVLRCLKDNGQAESRFPSGHHDMKPVETNAPSIHGPPSRGPNCFYGLTTRFGAATSMPLRPPNRRLFPRPKIRY
ncbi:hypothetical protein RL0633 [Rhizobium johnstonii 3841]|uniref:Uncharacterized protein n=1 Tax=Rhizobium johnstonii (strain DSM 114642 / LMG 32736 / 3841) TaxID=216596 RepID=Q1MLM6_RHIJ3|nr:hypothetical protein RL0633 [Rhizobium johnstonii 3841]